MTDTIWIDRDEQLEAVAGELERAPWIGIDTEFMREKTFFPKLCLLQISAPEQIWCIDTLAITDLSRLMHSLVGAGASKILHAARQDLEAIYLVTRQIVAPVFDTQIAAACVGMKAQLGYADLAKVLLEVTIGKSQTRTDWSRRPLSAAQLSYAADDVLHLHDIAVILRSRLQELGRTHWAEEDCAQLSNPQLYDPDPERAWTRLKGISQLAPRAGGIARALAAWRERVARDKDLPRSWILSDAGIFNLAHADPRTTPQVHAAASETAAWSEAVLATLLETVKTSESIQASAEALAQDTRPTPEQKALINRLAQILDKRATELGVSAEILATRSELKSMVMSSKPLADLNPPALRGWRKEQIGDLLTEAIKKNLTRAASAG